MSYISRFSAMDVLDLLEKRIAALELQVLPKNSDVAGSQVITDLLMQTHTMLQSALSCRESITTILNYMNTINDYLDPNNGESELEIDAKRHALLELYPELKDTVQLVSTIESLTPYTDSSNIMKVTELSGKLEQLAVTNLGIYDENREYTHNVIKCLQQYNDITSSIKILFGQLDKAMTDLEIALEPKITAEE